MFTFTLLVYFITLAMISTIWPCRFSSADAASIKSIYESIKSATNKAKHNLQFCSHNILTLPPVFIYSERCSEVEVCCQSNFCLFVSRERDEKAEVGCHIFLFAMNLVSFDGRFVAKVRKWNWRVWIIKRLYCETRISKFHDCDEIVSRSCVKFQIDQ